MSMTYLELLTGGDVESMKTITKTTTIFMKYEEAMYKEAARYYKKVIVPFCKKYNVKYWNIECEYGFYDGDKPPETNIQIDLREDNPLQDDEQFGKEIHAILEVLDTEFRVDEFFGSYVFDQKEVI